MAGSDPKRWSSGSAELSAWRSVSFDLDGTFADTSTDLADALNTLRLELGRQALPVPDVARHVGRGARWLVANCIDGVADDAIDELVLRFLDHYAGCCCRTTAPYEGLEQLVQTLRARGVIVSIATNKPRRFTELIIDGLGWGEWFDSVHCGDDGPSKPDPAMLDAAMKHAGTAPHEHLHIGDTPTDARAAENAGCWFTPVAWGMDVGAALKTLMPVGFERSSQLVSAWGS